MPPFLTRCCKGAMLSAASVVVLVCAWAGTAHAAAPATSGSYTSTAGTISTTSCPAGYTCGAAVSGDGFLQRTITDTSTGMTYFQTIVVPGTSTTVSGVTSFVDCSYAVQAGATRLNTIEIANPDPVTPWFFDVASLAGQDLSGTVQSATDSSCTSSAQFKFPLLTDMPELVADANELPQFIFRIIDGASGAAANGIQSPSLPAGVSLGLDQTVVEGGTAIVRVYVSGQYPSTPIVVPYTIGGSATPGVDHGAADGSVTLSPIAGAPNEISFPVYEDTEHDPGETVVITLGKPGNAIPGDNITETVTISERERLITASLKAMMDPADSRTRFSHLYLLQDCCAAAAPLVVTANARANFATGRLHYDWSGTDAALLALADVADDTLSFTPDRQSLPAGIYTVRVKVSALDSPEVSATAELPIKVVTDFDQGKWVPGSDSDSDGQLDGVETFIFDHNGNGIMDYLDAFHGANVLQMFPQPVNAGITTLDRTLDDGTTVSLEWDGFIDSAIADARQAIISDSGTALRLGRIAFDLETNGAAVPIDKFKRDAAVAFPGQAKLVAMDMLRGDTLVDIEVGQLPTPGQSVHVVMPRPIPPSADSVIWAYNPDRGWGRFRRDERNAIASMPGHTVAEKLFSCPDVHDPGFSAGADAECVRLTVEDGGPNDADGSSNGVVKLLIGAGPDIPDPVIKDSSGDNASAAKNASGSMAATDSSGGGGAFGAYGALLLALAVQIKRRDGT